MAGGVMSLAIRQTVTVGFGTGPTGMNGDTGPDGSLLSPVGPTGRNGILITGPTGLPGLSWTGPNSTSTGPTGPSGGSAVSVTGPTGVTGPNSLATSAFGPHPVFVQFVSDLSPAGSATGTLYTVTSNNSFVVKLVTATIDPSSSTDGIIIKGAAVFTQLGIYGVFSQCTGIKFPTLAPGISCRFVVSNDKTFFTNDVILYFLTSQGLRIPFNPAAHMIPGSPATITFLDFSP